MKSVFCKNWDVILTIVIAITIAVLFVTYSLKKLPWLIFVILIFTILELIVSIELLGSTIISMTRSQIEEYRNNGNLFSGAIAILLVSCCLYIFAYGINFALYGENADSIYSSLGNLVLGFTPAVISLLGIHFSNAKQEKYREEDLTRIYKPFVNISYRAIEDPNGSVIFDFEIKNIADNICVPDSINDKKLNITESAITKGDKCVIKSFTLENDSFSVESGTNEQKTIKFVFMDALENKYINNYIVNIPNLEEKCAILDSSSCIKRSFN